MGSSAQHSSPAGWRDRLDGLFKPVAGAMTSGDAGEEEIGERLGVVKSFWEDKGYGFIVDDEDGLDHFVHFRDIAAQGFKTLAPRQRVSFRAFYSKDGRRAARDVRVVNT